MNIRSIAVWGLLVGLFGSTQESTKTGDAEQEIRKIETLKNQFPLEINRWTSNVSPDAVFTQGNGVVISKEKLLDNYKKQGTSIQNSLEMKEPQFRRFGDTAVLTYIYTRTRNDGDEKQLVHQHLRRMAVYQRISGKWELIASTTVAIPNADRQQKPVDAALLDSYVGTYSDGSEQGRVTITRDGSRLMAQGQNEAARTELLAVTDNAFTMRFEGDTVLMVFEKGPDGRAARIRAHNIGGSEQVGERIK